ncbi:MAG TPA: DUF1700 domain-containing protein [Candidatus Blautia avistercoris]|uniref:DUF1700 domain-containing protein n=1 Tax=Blautia sp. An249 TaxID=1965603 RepID=UPI000B37C96C|nr:DUF1700 domain-containing protein [Blautia sp. An249]OUO78784.1 hypothetical protein B5F53_08880 [Blautia sp. An249]HIY18469.1 DUF1700 domain-containing protein [Candidatus Blautia avistercoris]
MNRMEFMIQLERLLADIPASERQEALEYYNSYFDDAGPENEASVIRELGSPGKVAAIIKADLRENNERYGEYTERGYTDTRMKEDAQMPQNPREARERGRRGYHPSNKQNTAKVVLLIIAAVIFLPVLADLSDNLFGLLVSILLFPVILAIGVIGATLGVFIGGVVMIVIGIPTCFLSVPGGILCIGIGFLLLAIGIILLLLSIWICVKVLPWLIRVIANGVQKLFHKGAKGGNQA